MRRKPIPSESLAVDDPSSEKILAQLGKHIPVAINHHADHANPKGLPSAASEPSSQDPLDIEHPSHVALMSQMTRYDEADSEKYLRRKPVRSGMQDRETPKKWILRQAGKPILGPRPMHHRQTKSDFPILQPSSGKANIDVRRKSIHSPSHSDQCPPEKSSKSIVHDRLRPGSFDKPRQRDVTHFPGTASSTLTLIRRYDGFQSNVAQVLIHSKNGDCTVESSASIAGSTLLKIMTPGYKSLVSPAMTLVKGTGSNETFQTPFSQLLHFGQDHTRVRQPLYRGSSNTLIHSPRASENGGSGHDFLSQTSINESEAFSSCQFDSLWGGRCSFSSGVTGRSLKCKHMLRPGQRLQNLSELRFNLPSSAALGPTAKRPALIAGSSESKRSSFFTNHKRQHSSSSTLVNRDNACDGPAKLEDRMGRLDLSLGQELAGGGFGGKQAKLGKLIIEPEGLKMLDLVVAANMAAWWRIYEKFV